MSKQKQRKEIDKAIQHLMDYAEQKVEWGSRLQDLFDQMIEPAAQDLQISGDELCNEIQQADVWHMVYGYVFEEFATSVWDDEQHSFIDDYLQQRGWREGVNARLYLRALNESELRLWEITNVKQGVYAEVRPFGANSKSIRVMEKSATESLQQWDCIAGRVVLVERIPMFTGGLLPLPPIEAGRVQRILDNTKEATIALFHDLKQKGEIDTLPDNLEAQAEQEANANLPEVLLRLWLIYVYQSLNRTMPVLLNKDAEDFQLITIHFPVLASQEQVAQALDGLAELDRTGEENVWLWLPGNANEIKRGEPVSILGHIHLKAKVLQLEVNSSERAERGRQLFEDGLRGLLGQALLVHENLSDQFTNTDLGDVAGFGETEAGKALIKAHMDRHYLQVLDEPVPMLGGKTPRECAIDQNSLSDVVEWLKYLENQSAKDAHSGYDFSWIWNELGLEKFKNQE